MKRIAAATLWFLVGWYVGSVAAFALGLGPLLAPIMGVALAGIVVADPRRIIWGGHAAQVTKPTARTTASADAPSI